MLLRFFTSAHAAKLGLFGRERMGHNADGVELTLSISEKSLLFNLNGVCRADPGEQIDLLPARIHHRQSAGMDPQNPVGLLLQE